MRETTSHKSHSLREAAGALMRIMYTSRITRPSARSDPLVVMKSLIGSSRILAITAGAASVPAACTALR